MPKDIVSGSIVDITVGQNRDKEEKAERDFRDLQDRIYSAFGASEPSVPVLRCRNATQTSVVLEWDPVQLATADLISLTLYRNGQRAGAIPDPTRQHLTKVSGLAVDTKYIFHLVLRTSAGTFTSEKVEIATHKMTDLSGITITSGILPAAQKEKLNATAERIGAKLADTVRLDTTHFVTTEGRGQLWEQALKKNIPVVRPEWVDACEKEGRILGVTKFYLDAMRPGPPVEEHSPSPAAAVTQKELPPEPQSATDGAKDTEEGEAAKEYAPLGNDKTGGDAAGQSSSEDEDDANDEDDAPEPKSRNAAPEEEQKARAEDFEDKKLALRPAAGTEDGKTSDDDEGDDDDTESKDGKTSKDDDGKGAAQTPDGASFTEVQL